MNTFSRRLFFFERCIRFALIGMALLIGSPIPSMAGPDETSFLKTQWGGHLRATGTVTWIDDESIFSLYDTDPYLDGQAELRLKNDMFLGKHLRLQTHYELVNQTGDTQEARNKLNLPTAGTVQDQLIGQNIDDDRRLMNLTHIISDGDRHVTFHRLDRLNLTYSNTWGTLRLGRQALTWGKGFIFNPQDLFNPFAPVAVLRDYKAGDDMAHMQLPLGNGEAQFLYLPRRDPDTGDVAENQSSYASKWHFPLASLEIDMLLARHYADLLAGAGVTGYLGGAAWRLDTLYTFLDTDEDPVGFWQLVANLDYAWGWFGKNFYGFLEFYYNEHGFTDEYDQALADPILSARLRRGELFTLGRYYLAGQLQIELHPLFQTYWTAIVNLSDGSLIFQPQLMWDVSVNWQFIAGATIYNGGDQTEYGGFVTEIGPTRFSATPNDSAFVWLTYYF
jgi:hypothetical protein